MKPISVLLTSLLLCKIAYAGAPDATPINVIGFSDMSCGAWVRSSQEPSARQTYLYWFRGFVSGYNYSTPKKQVETMPDNDTLAVYIDKYCREHPLHGFVGAAFDLVKELTADYNRSGRIR